MKILLIQPPIRDFYRTHQRTEPLGLRYIAASLRDAGHVVQVLDAMASDRSVEVAVPRELTNMKPYYVRADLSPFRLFSTYREFGISIDEVGRRCEEFAPDLVGISANFTPYAEEALECAREVKRRVPGLRVVLGGHHATIRAREMGSLDEVDFVVRGEGERTLCELAKVLAAGEDLSVVRGLVFRQQEGTIVETPDALPVEPLDALPWPLPSPTPFRMILTSRGCPRKCGFCSIEHVMGPRLRLREIDQVLAEVTDAVDAGARFIDFEDDNMNWHPDRMLRLMRELRARFAAKGIRFSAMNGLVAEKLTPEILAAMRDAGFDWLNLPVVSGDAEGQARIGRGQPVESFEQTIRAARECGLGVTAYLILGLPTDTLESMIRDVLWLAGLPVQIGPSVFYPVPGSRLHELCVARGSIARESATALRSSAYPVETEQFSRTDLVTLMRLCRLINFLKETGGSPTATADVKLSAASEEGPLTLTSDSRLDRESIGAHLCRRFLEDGRLLGLVARRHRKAPFLYEEIDLITSERVQAPVRAFLASQSVAGFA